MNVLVIADAAFPREAVVGAFRAAGHEVAVAEADARPRAAMLLEVRRRSGKFGAVVDLAARGAEDVDAVAATFGALAGHYLLVSGCEVYPDVPHLRPWRPEDLDLADDEGVPTLPPRTRALRSAERAIRLGSKPFPWTIVRPAIVDGAEDPTRRAAYFVSRILEGGPIVLPDDNVPLHRRVFVDDLARALLLLAGNAAAHGRIENVVGEGLLSGWAHAAMLMDGVGRRVPFAYVPAQKWREAGLSLPIEAFAHASLVAPSPLLHGLGWRPTNELEGASAIARAVMERRPVPDPHARNTERRILHETSGISVEAGAGEHVPLKGRQWRLMATAGAPATVALEPLEQVAPLPPPILRVRQVALGLAERLLVSGELPTRPGRRVLGHNAVVEVVEPGPTSLVPGAPYLPLARLPCDEPTCAFCREPVPATLGLDTDGYGARFVTTPAHHLVRVPDDVLPFALLADPLATLLDAFLPRIEAHPGPVWITGRTAEAGLAGYLAHDAGRPVRHLERTGVSGEFPVHAIEESLHALKQSELVAPAIGVELSGSAELGRMLAGALAKGGLLVTLRPLTHLPSHLTVVNLPSAAPNRARLEEALQRLQRWSSFRDLAPRVGPAVPPELFWDAFLPAPFSLPFLEERS